MKYRASDRMEALGITFQHYGCIGIRYGTVALVVSVPGPNCFALNLCSLVAFRTWLIGSLTILVAI